MRRPHLATVDLAAALLVLAFAASLPAPAQAQEEPAPGPTVERLDLRRATVADAARLIAETAAWNIIATPEAGAREVTLLLQGVSMRTALESLCKASSLGFHPRIKDCTSTIAQFAKLDFRWLHPWQAIARLSGTVFPFVVLKRWQKRRC